MKLLANRKQFAAHMPQGVVAEVGVHLGEHAKVILECCNPEKLYLIDCWQDQTTYEVVVAEFGERCTVVREWSVAAATSFPDEYFDWVYVDAAHDKSSVTSDLTAWWPKVKRDGLLCGHDYLLEVKEAVDEFLVVNDLSLEYLTSEKHGSFAIRRPM